MSSKQQIPHGPEDRNCPFWQKPMSEVCHNCELWKKLRGRDPQSMQEMDEYRCSFWWLPTLLIENSAQQRSTAAAVETMTTEIKKTDVESTATINTLMGLINQTMHQATVTAAALQAANQQLQIAAPNGATKQIAHQ